MVLDTNTFKKKKIKISWFPTYLIDSLHIWRFNFFLNLKNTTKRTRILLECSCACVLNINREMIPCKQKQTHYNDDFMCELYSNDISVACTCWLSQCLFFFSTVNNKTTLLQKKKEFCHTKLIRNHVINFGIKYNFGTILPLLGERMPKFILDFNDEGRYRSKLPWRMRFSFVRGKPCFQFQHTADFFFFYKWCIGVVCAHFRVEKFFFAAKTYRIESDRWKEPKYQISSFYDKKKKKKKKKK